MPIYEYECQACGEVQELMQKVDAPAPDSCDRCQNGPMVKLMSRTGFILKGTGWYVTDFRGGSQKSTKKDEGGSGSSGSQGSSEGSSGSGGSGACGGGACGAAANCV